VERSALTSPVRLQKTRSPSSHKTWKLLLLSVRNREDGITCQAPLPPLQTAVEPRMGTNVCSPRLARAPRKLDYYRLRLCALRREINLCFSLQIRRCFARTLAQIPEHE